METIDFKGLWWLPDDPENHLSGVLQVEHGRPILETLGDFGHEELARTATEVSYSTSLETHERILGISADGKDITLERSQGSPGHKMNFPGLSTASYAYLAALVGKHFESGDPVEFDEVAISATDLNAWTQVNGFSGGVEMRDEGGPLTFVGMNVNFTGPEDIRIPLSGNDEAFIRFRITSKGMGFRSASVSMTQDAELHLRFRKKTSLNQVIERVGQVRNLLSLAVGRPVAILKVTGFRHDHTEGPANTPRPISVLWDIPHNPSPPTRDLLPNEMLFSLPEDQADAKKVFDGWFRKQERLKPVFNLFFGSRHHPDMSLEVRFLTYAQAVETYDFRRRRKPGNLTLAQRVSDILGLRKTVSRKLVGEDLRPEGPFIKIFKDSRNYYTHYNPNKEKKAAKGVALYLLTVQLQAVLEMCLLRELGFGARDTDEIFDRVGRYDEIDYFRCQI